MKFQVGEILQRLQSFAYINLSALYGKIHFLLLFSFYKSHTFLQIGERNDYLPNQLCFFPCQFLSKLLTGHESLKSYIKEEK